MSGGKGDVDFDFFEEEETRSGSGPQIPEPLSSDSQVTVSIHNEASDHDGDAKTPESDLESVSSIEDETQEEPERPSAPQPTEQIGDGGMSSSEEEQLDSSRKPRPVSAKGRVRPRSTRRIQSSRGQRFKQPSIVITDHSDDTSTCSSQVQESTSLSKFSQEAWGVTKQMPENSDAYNMKLLLHAVLDLDRQNAPKSGLSRAENKRAKARVIKSLIKQQSGQAFTFAKDQITRIENENQMLMDKIIKQMTRKPKLPAAGLQGKLQKRMKPGNPRADLLEHVRRLTPLAVHRTYENRRIERENMDLLKRLTKTNATRGYTKEEQLKDWQRQYSSFGLTPSNAFHHKPGTIRRPRRMSQQQSASTTKLGKTRQVSSYYDMRRAETGEHSAPLKKLRPSSAKSRAKPQWDSGW